MKIVVRMPNWIGDLVMATPILADLRKQYPDAQIDTLCRKIGALIENDPNIDHLLPYDALLRGYEMGILLTGSFSSAWQFWRSKVGRRIGFRGDWRRWLLTDAVPIPKDQERRHLVTTYKQLLQPLDIAISKTAPKLHLLEKERQAAKLRLAKLGVHTEAVVGINPGAAFGSAKCWLPERFALVATNLLRFGKRVLFFGAPSQVDLVNQICEQIKGPVINLAGKTSLRELMALLSLCERVLTNDSGPMHIAAAFGRPVVALFGSTNPVKTGPYGQEGVIYKQAPCSPCYRRVCPIDFRCMKQIQVEEVTRSLMR